MALGLGCTVRELLTRLDLAELLAWQAYYDVEPWGETRADLRQAVALHYQLSPWMDDEAQPPDLVWPYFEDPAEAAIEVAMAQERLRELEDQWSAHVAARQ